MADAGYRANRLQNGRATLCTPMAIVPDATYAGMWRVELPDGQLTENALVKRVKRHICIRIVRLCRSVHFFQL
jgi:hypothetical protein